MIISCCACEPTAWLRRDTETAQKQRPSLSLCTEVPTHRMCRKRFRRHRTDIMPTSPCSEQLLLECSKLLIKFFLNLWTSQQLLLLPPHRVRDLRLVACLTVDASTAQRDCNHFSSTAWYHQERSHISGSVAALASSPANQCSRQKDRPTNITESSGVLIKGPTFAHNTSLEIDATVVGYSAGRFRGAI